MDHQYYMKMAFQSAQKGIGFTTPNPLVGAVLVRGHEILGTGFHQKSGEAHAEVNAIADALQRGLKLKGSTLYCNLEPCVHLNKKTPPCAPLIVKEKIAKVVIANTDPNPEVAGKGVDYLRAHGIEVVTDVLSSEGAILNEVFFTNMKKNRPFVHLKMAQSLDGKIATKIGESKYITGAEALKRTHALRQKYDGIMVGRKTIDQDDPSLTMRSDEFEIPSHPLRMVVASLDHLKISAKVFNDEWKENTLVLSKVEANKNNAEVVKFLDDQGVRWMHINNREDNRLNCELILKALYNLNNLNNLKISSILIEGGPTLATEFLKQKMVDKISIFIAPILIGEGKNSFLDLGVQKLQDKFELYNLKVEKLGNDILLEGYTCLQD